jgi:hypothetical protein
MSEALYTLGLSGSGEYLRWRSHPLGKHAPADHYLQKMELPGRGQMRSYEDGSEEVRAYLGLGRLIFEVFNRPRLYHTIFRL